VVSRSKKFGLVIELKWGETEKETAKQALGQIAYRDYLSNSCISEEQMHINHFFVIGVAVNPNKLLDEDPNAVEVIIEQFERKETDGQKFVENFRDYLKNKYPEP
jgi:hypothetical protein